jgi:hypothetical protein
MDDRHDKSIIGRDADAAPTHAIPESHAPKSAAIFNDNEAACDEDSDLDIVFERETPPHGAH